jgi:hypothetical protein
MHRPLLPVPKFSLGHNLEANLADLEQRSVHTLDLELPSSVQSQQRLVAWQHKIFPRCSFTNPERERERSRKATVMHGREPKKKHEVFSKAKKGVNLCVCVFPLPQRG